MDYAPPPQPPPPLYDTRHFQPWDIGMDPQIGGMGREDWQTWTPAGPLVSRATSSFTPQAQAYFQNRQLRREPPPNDSANRDGEYNGNIYVRRMGRDGSYPTNQQESDLVRHELLHAASYEHAPYLQDLRSGLPALRKAIMESGWMIPPEIANDPDHIFTGAAEAVANGTAPPPLRAYFADMLR